VAGVKPDDAVVAARCARCQERLGWVLASEDGWFTLDLEARRKAGDEWVSFPVRTPVQAGAHTAYRCPRCGAQLDIDHDTLTAPAERARPGKPITVGIHPPADRSGTV
jgi:hypothetical protein